MRNAEALGRKERTEGGRKMTEVTQVFKTVIFKAAALPFQKNLSAYLKNARLGATPRPPPNSIRRWGSGIRILISMPPN